MQRAAAAWRVVRLGARELDALPPEQAACVRVCAVLGQEFSRDELAWVQSAAERDRTATTTLDTDVGLESLAAQEIISNLRQDIWAFSRVMMMKSVSAGLYAAPPAQGPAMTEICGTTPEACTLR